MVTRIEIQIRQYEALPMTPKRRCEDGLLRFLDCLKVQKLRHKSNLRAVSSLWDKMRLKSNVNFLFRFLGRMIQLEGTG